MTRLDHLLSLKPIYDEENTPKQAFFSRRISFTYNLHPILSVAQSTHPPRSLSFFLFFGDHGEGFLWRGVAVAILTASLSSGKKTGFSDINGMVGGTAGGVG